MPLPAGAALLLAACRCGPLLLAMPLLGLGGRLVALGLGTLLLAPLIWPAVAGAEPQAWLYLRELLIGGTLALAAAVPWAVAHSLGALLDDVRADRSRSRAAAGLYGILALASFLGLGGARTVVTALAASYELLPLLPAARVSTAAPGLALIIERLLSLTARLALPLLAAQLLAELLVALLARWEAPAQRRPSLTGALSRALIWMCVLWLGVQTLLPAVRQLVRSWPQLFRAALSGI